MGIVIDASHRWQKLKNPKAGDGKDMLSLGVAQLGKLLLKKYLEDATGEISVDINNPRFFEGYEALVKGNLAIQFKHPSALDMKMSIRVAEENAFEVEITTTFQGRDYKSNVLSSQFGAYTKEDIFARIDDFRKKDYGDV